MDSLVVDNLVEIRILGLQDNIKAPLTVPQIVKMELVNCHAIRGSNILRPFTFREPTTIASLAACG